MSRPQSYVDFKAAHGVGPGKPFKGDPQAVWIAAYVAGVQSQREADAALARERGCVCRLFFTGDPGGYGGTPHLTLEAWAKASAGAPKDKKYAGHIHDPRCPEALADAILAGGGG